MGTAARQIVIEKAAPTDGKTIYEIGTLCFSDAWREETVLHDMEGDYSCYFIAKVDGEIAGYGCFWFIADEGQLVNIGVHPDYRRQGIGEAILTRGIEEARERGMRTMFLEVRVSNLGAQKMYEKFGFQNLGLRKKVYDLPMEDGYVMQREI